MSDTKPSASRRTVLIGAAMIAGVPLIAPELAVAGVVTQANAKYQAMPKGAAHCAICSYYLPAAKPGANGACKQVAGSISPNGWCQFYAQKAGA